MVASSGSTFTLKEMVSPTTICNFAGEISMVVTGISSTWIDLVKAMDSP